MRIAYDNLFDTATVAASSADASYPIANAADQRLSMTWKATSVAAQSVTIDLGSAQEVTCFALMSHNITSSVTVTFKGGSTTAVSAVTSTISHNENMMLLFAASQTYRYWQLDIGANTSAVEIGRIWLGPYIDIEPSSLLDFRVIKKRSDQVIYGRNRQKWSSEGVGWRRFELSFPETQEAMIQKLCTMYDHSRNHSSLIFCNFDSIRDYTIVEPCYCSIDGELAFTHSNRMKHRWQLNLEEEL